MRVTQEQYDIAAKEKYPNRDERLIIWTWYLQQRQGTYEQRVPRYKAAVKQLLTMGLDDDSIILDFGAGWCEFDYYLRRSKDWKGRIINVDGAINGQELNRIYKSDYTDVDFVVCLETIEHLEKPGETIFELENYVTSGLVFTTPNPETVDVLAMDETHSVGIGIAEWTAMKYEAEARTLRGTENDTILAWKDVRSGEAAD